MVISTPSTTIGDDRKRKVTYERAKVVHLSRQLQLRLQYARLKVEHGWHKQNLNEVENLYFRHSHTKPRLSVKELPSMACPVTPATQQSLQTSSMTEIHGNPQKTDADEASRNDMQTDEVTSEGNPSTPQPQATVTSTVPNTPEDAPIPALEPSPMSLDFTQMANRTAQESITHHSPFSTVPQLTPATKPPLETVPTYPISSYYGALLSSQTAVAYTPRYGPLPPSSPSVLLSSHNPPSVVSGTPAVPSQGQSPATASSSAVPDPFKFGTAATASLTYDSFWSTHLSSKSRAALASRSSDNLSSKPSIMNPLHRRTTSDIAQALSGILSAGSPSTAVVQPGGTQHLQQPEVSSRV